MYRLGCKGPSTYNACATMRWNSGTSWPVESGHPCLGCSEPKFWDAGGFYAPLSAPLGSPGSTLLAAGVTGAVVGGAAAALAKRRTATAEAGRQPVKIDELEQKL
jgi:hydrogenase small subunit